MSRQDGLENKRLDEPEAIHTAENASGAEVFRLFSKLPDEITMNILDRLDILSKVRLRRACKKWDAFLRDEYLLRLVKFDEQSTRMFCQSTFLSSVYSLLETLSSVGVWKKVRHLILNGDYDVSSEEIHGDLTPWTRSDLFAALIAFLRECKENQSGEFGSLETFEVQNSAVELLYFDMYTEATAMMCKFIVTSGSLLLWLPDATYEIGFDIPGSRTFDLSGKMVVYEELSIPVEIAELIKEQCDTVPAEKVSQLGEVYSDLLKGRPGILIREDVKFVFFRACYDSLSLPRDWFDPKRPHWQQCKNYDFNSLDKMTKYALAFYSKPRNCFQVLTPRTPYNLRRLENL